MILIQKLDNHGVNNARVVDVVYTGGLTVRRRRKDTQKLFFAIAWKEVVRTLFNFFKGQHFKVK